VVTVHAVRRLSLTAASVLLLAGPTVLAFFSGGYFDEPRLWAAIGASTIVLAVAITGKRPLPRTGSGRLAVAGLAAMTAWTAVSFAWAPVGGPAVDTVERLVLYLGALLAAVALLRRRRVAAALEPALAAGAVVVIAEGLSGRLLPGLVTLSRSARAGARLEQPITYWNAEGALAAGGFVLCARITGDRRRPTALRATAAAACAPLGAGVYLTFSRGAVAAAVLGLLVLLAVAPTWSQVRGIGIAAFAAVLGAVASAVSPAVASLSGSLARREREGVLVLAALVLAALAAGVLAFLQTRAERRGRLRSARLRSARPVSVAAVIAATLIAVGLPLVSLQEHGGTGRSNSGPSRLTSVKSNRHEYWRVGVRAFVDNPVRGLGAGGFRVAWLRERRITEGVLDVHSLELEYASELGLVGLLTLVLFIGGVAGSARLALRREPLLAAGPIAALAAWLLHASIDWDWEMPALALTGILLAGALIAAAEESPTKPLPDVPQRGETESAALSPAGVEPTG
jgi:hypothetical protein